MTTVSIFADASVYPDRCGCGWSFKSGTTVGNGNAAIVKQGLKIHEAELWGLCIAICEATARHTERPLTLVVQCDSLAALQSLLRLAHKRLSKSVAWLPRSEIKSRMDVGWHPRSALRPRATSRVLSPFEIDCLEAIRSEQPTRIRLKHVKGHRGSSDARSRINTLTDALAKEATK